MSAPTPFPLSLCHRCRHLSRVESRRGSVFLRCLDPERPKYPPQPVQGCDRFTPLAPAAR